MNKEQLVTSVSSETSLTKTECQRVIEATLRITKEYVLKGEKVKLMGFGTFYKAKRQAKKGRNPNTGEKIIIKPKYIPSFRAGKEFRKLLSN